MSYTRIAAWDGLYYIRNFSFVKVISKKYFVFF